MSETTKVMVCNYCAGTGARRQREWLAQDESRLVGYFKCDRCEGSGMVEETTVTTVNYRPHKPKTDSEIEEMTRKLR